MIKMKKVAIINGPNINILGVREPQIYGQKNLIQIEKELENYAKKVSVSLVFFQSNHEGNIVDFIQQNMDKLDAVIINPAAFSKIGYSILDALNANGIPYIEVHLSNIVNRGHIHDESIFTQTSIGCIIGFKSYVYLLGLYAINDYFNNN